jgi:AraC-like DNA-binding protein
MNTATPVGEIAINNGFPNSKAFAKMFRDQYGILPSEYRKDKKRL